MSVVTLAEAKTHLNITATTNDTELQAFIDRAEAALGQRVGPLGPISKTERVPGWRTVLRLSFTPVISLTTVTSVEGTQVPVGQLTALSGGRVEFTQVGYFPSRFYDVTYQAGRSTLPDDLKLAVLELVRHLWGTQRGGSVRPGSAPSDAMSNTIPGAAYLFPFRVEQLIAPHVPVLGA